MFAHFKLKTRLLLGYSVPILLFAVLGAIAYYGEQNHKEIIAEVRLAQTKIQHTNQAVMGISRMLRNVRGQVLFPQDYSYRESYQAGQRQFRQAATELEALMQEQQERQQLEILIEEGDRYHKISAEIFRLLQMGNVAEAADLTLSLRMSKSDGAYKAILAETQLVLEQGKSAEKAAENFLILVVVGGTLFGAFLTFLIGLWLASKIGGQMNEAASSIANTSNEIAATTAEQESTAAQQAIACTELSAAMKQLKHSSQASASQARSASAGAAQVLTLADGGAAAVKQTLTKMAALDESVGAIATQITRLKQQANQIGNIAALASNLAAQTNMLALNAAVEAVRAGEHGKGFSVVASEIRKLADESQNSAMKINDLVSDIQSAIDSTVAVTEKGTQTVEEGVTIARETAAAFAGVTDAINSVVLSSKQISSNAQQQAIAIQQVVEAVGGIESGARETAGGIAQVRIGTQLLSEAAENLKAMV